MKLLEEERNVSGSTKEWMREWMCVDILSNGFDVWENFNPETKKGWFLII